MDGFNVNVAAATPLNLHRADALTSTFAAVAADLLAKVVETARKHTQKSIIFDRSIAVIQISVTMGTKSNGTFFLHILRHASI